MPKIVDHEARRAELAEAMWRVVYRDGAGAVSVRSVAAEAGWSPSALRHYFTTQTDLLAFAMEHVIARATARIITRHWTGPAREVVQQVLEELLPLDQQRARELEVWLLLAARNPADPGARARVAEADDGVRQVVTLAVSALADAGLLAEERDPPAEITRLHALIDGLAVHALLRPDRMPPEQVRATLARHLDDLRLPPAPPPPAPPPRTCAPD